MEECKLGLHFSKNPANVFKFYEPLSYNRYFKVRAYGNIVDGQDGVKTIAQIIEFVEEYDLMEFIEKIKEYYGTDSGIHMSYGTSRSVGISHSYGVNDSIGIDKSKGVDSSIGISSSYGVNYSNGINWSYGINECNGVNNSKSICYSNGINESAGINWSNSINRTHGAYWSNGINKSSGVYRSRGISESFGISRSYGIRQCTGISESIFCNKIEGKEHYLFNKKIDKKRFDEVFEKILSFNYFPNFNNLYELKGNKEWWAVCFPELMTVDDKTAWSEMPPEMKEYIQSLPEYDEEVFKAITEME